MRIEWSADLVAVQLAGFQALDESMPNEFRPRLELDNVGRFAVFLVKQQEKDLACILRIQREVDSAATRLPPAVVLSIETFRVFAVPILCSYETPVAGEIGVSA